MKPSTLLCVLLAAGAVLLVVSLVARQSSGPVIQPGSTLVLELEGEYVEAPQATLLARALGEGQRPFVSLLSTLSVAERDDRLAAVVLVIRPMSIGWGKADELRRAIGRLRDAGRKTVAFLAMHSCVLR